MIHAANLTALTGASESRSSSSPSNSSQESLVVEYADEVKQTLQKKDYRPVSTLHRKTFAERTLAEHLVARALMPESYHELKPASLDRGPLPVRKSWEDHLWILPRAMAVPLIQQASYWAFPNFLWPVYMAYPLYFFGLSHFLILSIRHFQVYAEKWGTLDEKNIGRDRIPDVSIPQLACYTAHVEVLGHTGIRAHWGPPITGPVLALFGLDATIEDHDLHHRYGKSGRNFGKQSILWDHIFGTTTPREETAL
ncbi:hypothetical protein RQP46_002608 [Phenoliferia psychrophenolica]